jgi:ferredoxin--NADP+ reductase
VVGATTALLNTKKEGEYISDFVGPLGTATKLDGLKKVCIVGGGVGCAIALPVASALKKMGCDVTSVIGFRSKELLILEDEFKSVSNRLFVMTDDGSYGQKGLVTDALKELIEAGNQYDEIFAIGPMIMMKFVCKTTEPYGIPTTVSMSPIMIDGTGMCGGCRLSVGGEMKFACVDGPDFDGHKVDWDLAVKRNATYAEFEKHKHEETCNLFKKEVQ